jgi:hypothetical protein
LAIEANADAAPYHDRQMALLRGEQRIQWLGLCVCEDEILHPLAPGDKCTSVLALLANDTLTSMAATSRAAEIGADPLVEPMHGLDTQTFAKRSLKRMIRRPYDPAARIAADRAAGGYDDLRARTARRVSAPLQIDGALCGVGPGGGRSLDRVTPHSIVNEASDALNRLAPLPERQADAVIGAVDILRG